MTSNVGWKQQQLSGGHDDDVSDATVCLMTGATSFKFLAFPSQPSSLEVPSSNLEQFLRLRWVRTYVLG